MVNYCVCVLIKYVMCVFCFNVLSGLFIYWKRYKFMRYILKDKLKGDNKKKN